MFFFLSSPKINGFFIDISGLAYNVSSVPSLDPPLMMLAVQGENIH